MNFSRNGNPPDTTVTAVSEPSETMAAPTPPEPGEESTREQPLAPVEYATRSSAKPREGVSKQKILFLGGGLGLAVLFFIFTAIVDKSKKPSAPKPMATAQQTTPTKPKGSVTPVMESVKSGTQTDTDGQLAPGDILRTRTLDPTAAQGIKPADVSTTEKSTKETLAPAGSLGAVPSFAQTQQRWEDPAPYGELSTNTSPDSSPQATREKNGLKEASLVFVRSAAQTASTASASTLLETSNAPVLQIASGTRIEAKLQTQISSAVQTPVVAIVEYTYAIGSHIVVPAGARVYGQLQQADRSGLMSVKFDEIELLDGQREQIDAVGTGLDLGPIKGDVYGKNTGRNILVRAISGIGAVAAELAGNNNSAAFSEDDMIRDRLAENIGTTGDSEIMNLNANSRSVVSVPADTKIYVVFTKHQDTSAGLHRVAAATP
jgi:type IV secretory pathway VirB10-like protein